MRSLADASGYHFSYPNALSRIIAHIQMQTLVFRSQGTEKLTAGPSRMSLTAPSDLPYSEALIGGVADNAQATGGMINANSAKHISRTGNGIAARRYIPWVPPGGTPLPLTSLATVPQRSTRWL